MRFRAAGTPMSLGRRWDPPAAGNRPKLTSGSPSLALKGTEAQSMSNRRGLTVWGFHVILLNYILQQLNHLKEKCDGCILNITTKPTVTHYNMLRQLDTDAALR